MFVRGRVHFVNRLFGSDCEEDDNFGASVSMYDDYAVIGAPTKDYIGNNKSLIDAGAAYVFTKTSPNNDNGSWIQTFKLIPNDIAAYDLFGTGVDIFEDLILVGSSNATINTTAVDIGAVYVFKKAESGDEWHQIMKFWSNESESGDEYGTNMLLTEKFIFVGAPLWGTASNYHQGKIYVYNRNNCSDDGGLNSFASDGSGVALCAKDIIQGFNANYANFGRYMTLEQSISISNNNTIFNGTNVDYNYNYSLLVGNYAYNDSKGGIYQFTNDYNDAYGSGEWVYDSNERIFANDGKWGVDPHDNFGYSLAVRNNYKKSVDEIDTDIDILVVGAVYRDYDFLNGSYGENVGSVYIFNKDSNDPDSDWIQMEILNATTNTSFGAQCCECSFFGKSVAIENDLLIITAPLWWKEFNTGSCYPYSGGVGSAYVYYRDATSSSWLMDEILTTPDWDDVKSEFSGLIDEGDNHFGQRVEYKRAFRLSLHKKQKKKVSSGWCVHVLWFWGARCCTWQG